MADLSKLILMIVEDDGDAVVSPLTTAEVLRAVQLQGAVCTQADVVAHLRRLCKQGHICMIGDDEHPIWAPVWA